MTITKVILAVMLLALPSLATSQDNNRGVSWILQMCSEKASWGDIRAAYKDADVINAGWMYLTSNPNRCKNAPYLLADKRPKRIRIDICNSTCFPERGRQCAPQECFAGMTAKSASAAIMKNDAQLFKRVDKAINMAKSDLKKAVNLKDLAIKACLECTLSIEARIKLNSYVESKFRGDYPAARYVDNPWGSSCRPNMLCEKHGNPAVGENLIADNDGLDYDTINQYSYWKSNKNAYMVLGWKLCNNGLDKSDKVFIPGVLRRKYCKAARDGVDFSSATKPDAIIVGSPVAPVDLKVCKNIIKPAFDGKGGFVLKLSDGRAHGTTLLPARFSSEIFGKVEIRKNGKVVDYSPIGHPAYRHGALYSHDPAGAQRRIYDFRKHPNSYPDNSILRFDSNCYILEKPRFRID